MHYSRGSLSSQDKNGAPQPAIKAKEKDVGELMNNAATHVYPSKEAIAEVRRGEPVAQYRCAAAENILDGRERDVLLKVLERVLVGIYAHLPLKQARFGFDPVQRLRILRPQVRAMSDAEFHAEIGNIFASLRDAHTVYLRPGARNRVAVLPFMLEMFGSVEHPRYLVSQIEPDVRRGQFVRGVEVETWNDDPIDRVVQRHGESEAGGRADSMRGWAIMTLTSRSLEKCDMSDEDRVTIGFRTVDATGVPTGDRQFTTFEWMVIDTTEVKDWLAKRSEPATGGARIKALNPTAAAVKRAKQLLFASNTLSGEAAPRPAISFETKIAGNFYPARAVSPSHREACCTMQLPVTSIACSGPLKPEHVTAISASPTQGPPLPAATRPPGSTQLCCRQPAAAASS